MDDEELGFFAGPALRDLTVLYPETFVSYLELGRRVRDALFGESTALVRPYYYAALELLKYGSISGSKDLAIVVARVAAVDALLSISTSRNT